MDSVTQALLGATIGEAGFRHRLGRRALAVGALCGTLPDLDVVTSLVGPWTSMILHRGPTHSLLLIPFFAPAVGWAAHRSLGRPGDGGPLVWVQLAFWAIFTHPLLDLFTAYGTQILYPLSSRRFALDGMSIIDPIYTLPLLGAVLVAARRGAGPKSRKLAGAVLVLTTAYALSGWARSSAVVARVRAPAAVEVRALPMLGTHLAFRVVAKNRQAVFLGFARSGAKDDIPLVRIPRGHQPLVERALETRAGEIFRWFTDGFWFARLEAAETGTVARVFDLRYGSALYPEVSLWGAEASFAPDGRIREVRRFQAQQDLDWGAELSALLEVLRGENPLLRDRGTQQTSP